MESAHASSFQDSAADVMAVIVLIIVPVIAIAVFWLVHILPEKIAEKRHHPQKDAIKTLCLLSLVFGGMLWPFAWLWAYSRPVLHQLAYGRDKHDDYYAEQEVLVVTDDGATTEKVPADAIALRAEIETLRQQVQELADRGEPVPVLQPLQQRLDEMAKTVDRRL